MATTGIVKKPFPYAADGVNIETLKEGRVFAFPDQIFVGLKDDGYVAESKAEPENSLSEALEREPRVGEFDTRLAAASDQELKDIIARSGAPVSGNLVHAYLVALAKAQLVREAAGRKPAKGIDPNSGVTEQPLAAPGAPTPPSVKKAAKAATAEVEKDEDAKSESDAAEAKDAK